jgi:hypothetical protein
MKIHKFSNIKNIPQKSWIIQQNFSMRGSVGIGEIRIRPPGNLSFVFDG